ncbi:unannotated protein [freshwater metagenome]|uniref:Unannotated protein n=1 Tax=freshwater metagenome TaxID=449393 RepID=A0A6J7CH28_9ZZZZ
MATRLGTAKSLLSATEALYISMNPRRVLEFATRLEQLVKFPASVYMLKQRYGSVFRDDDVGVTANGGQPLAEFLGVRHGGRQRHDRNILRQVKNDFFPHGSAELIGQVVNFVHDDEAKVFEQVTLGVEHVAQDLGRHDDDARGRVDTRIAGQQSDLVNTIDCLQVLEFLVR